MTASPELSVVMSVYNGQEYLEESIESILKQSYDQFEFIIVNDGSSDDTKTILERYAAKDKRIILIHQDNMGLAKSLNKGIRMANGRYIARQDADDVSMLDRLETQKNYWIVRLYSAMGRVYSFDYPAAKTIFIENSLFYPTSCSFGYIFSDPRAYEDSNYFQSNYEGRFFFSLLKHLELEFKIEWLKKLPPHQLKLLRNGIFATYGWEYKDPKLKNWFNSYLTRTCRNGVCGKAIDKYNDSLLTAIDKKNIDMIKELEK